ncbi:MAG: methyl-accepting chemotaxis protein [Comamonas sp.]
MAVQLRNGLELGASYISTANLAADHASQQFFSERFRALQKVNAEVLTRFGESVQSEHGKASFAKMIEHLGRADPLIDRMESERASGANVSHLVRDELLPMVEAFSSQLDDMVKQQRQLHAEKLAQTDVLRQRALTLGLACWLVVTALGLLVSAWLVRQFTVPLKQAVELADAIAAGDLSRSVADDRKDELGNLLNSLNTMSTKLRTMVSTIRQGVDSVSSAASQIASGNQDLSSRTEQTATNLEQTASSLEELTSAVSQSADTAHQAKQLSVTAVQAAEQGGEVVNQVIMSMDQINTSSRKISDIISVIDGIAFQTNILALNAAVEAARAGEQGRGFAVVAGEVRSLAGRSAEAAKEIKALITASVGNVEVGAQQVSEAGQSMQAIVASVRRVTDLIEEITASTSEQRDGITQVNQAVNNLDQMTQQNAALVEESSAAAASMSEQAQRLSQVVSAFSLTSASQTSLRNT